jgi:dethiobiotin synthetase
VSSALKFFITGTGTGVGKTIVTRAITGALIKQGVDAVAVKPVESGVRYRAKDAEALSAVSGRPLSARDVSVYTFKDPVSPHLAAAREGRRIEKEPILRFLDHWVERADVVIAEGAGGLLVPLNDRITYADLIADTGAQLIIVVANVLGAINATLLTIEAARARHISIAGVILNQTAGADLGNREAISTHGRVEVLGEFPTTDAALVEAAQQTLRLDGFNSAIY